VGVDRGGGRRAAPVAEEFAARAEAAGWWAPADLTAQRFTAWDGSPRLANGELDRRIHDDMAAERADNASWEPRPPEKEGVRYGACWWSVPPFAEVSWTTPAAGPLPAVSAAGFFDTGIPYPDCAGADILAVEIDPAARVAEINGPDDWRDLTAAYPRDVTGTHDGEWRYWGGVPGPWRLPDWERVATTTTACMSARAATSLAAVSPSPPAADTRCSSPGCLARRCGCMT
jgi:hypothetical protein